MKGRGFFEGRKDAPNVFNLLGEHDFVLALLIERMVNTHPEEAVNLAQVSQAYYNVFRGVLEAKRLLELTIAAGEFNSRVREELADIELIIMQYPQLMFRYSEVNGRRTSPVKQAIANMDAYLLDRFMHVAKENGLWESFVKHAAHQDIEVNIDGDDQLCEAYLAEFEEWSVDEDLFWDRTHQTQLKEDTSHKIGVAQRGRMRFFFDAMCSVKGEWPHQEGVEGVVPPEQYIAFDHASNQYVDLTHLPPELSLGENFALRRGVELPEIEAEVMPADVCRYDQSAWHTLFNQQKAKVDSIIQMAREYESSRKA